MQTTLRNVSFGKIAIHLKKTNLLEFVETLLVANLSLIQVMAGAEEAASDYLTNDDPVHGGICLSLSICELTNGPW